MLRAEGKRVPQKSIWTLPSFVLIRVISWIVLVFSLRKLRLRLFIRELDQFPPYPEICQRTERKNKAVDGNVADDQLPFGQVNGGLVCDVLIDLSLVWSWLRRAALREVCLNVYTHTE